METARIDIGNLGDDVKPSIFDQVSSPKNMLELGALMPPKLFNNTDLNNEESQPSIMTEIYES